jgi:hypothetical protein
MKYNLSTNLTTTNNNDYNIVNTNTNISGDTNVSTLTSTGTITANSLVSNTTTTLKGDTTNDGSLTIGTNGGSVTTGGDATTKLIVNGVGQFKGGKIPTSMFNTDTSKIYGTNIYYDGIFCHNGGDGWFIRGIDNGINTNGSLSDLEIASLDEGTERIVFRQYKDTAINKEIILMDISGNTTLNTLTTKNVSYSITPNTAAKGKEIATAEWVLSKLTSSDPWYREYSASSYTSFTNLIAKILADNVHTAYIKWDANYTASTTATIPNTSRLQRIIIDNSSVTMSETIRNILNIGGTYTTLANLKTNLFDRSIDVVVKGDVSLDIINYGGVVNLISGRPSSTFYGRLTCYNPMSKPDNPYNSWNYHIYGGLDASGGTYGLFHIIADAYNFTVKSNWLGFYKFSSMIEAGTVASRYNSGALMFAAGNVAWGTMYGSGSMSFNNASLYAVDDNTKYGDNWLYAVTLTPGVENYGSIITVAGDSNMRFFRNISGSAIRLRPRGGSRVYLPYGDTTYNGFTLDQVADTPTVLGNFIVNG